MSALSWFLHPVFNNWILVQSSCLQSLLPISLTTHFPALITLPSFKDHTMIFLIQRVALSSRREILFPRLQIFTTVAFHTVQISSRMSDTLSTKQIPVPEIVASFFGGLKPITHVFKPLKSQTSWEGLYLFILQTFISHHLQVGIKTWDGLSVLMGCHQYGGILRGLPIFLCLHHVDSAGSNFDSSYLIEITQFQQCIQEQGMCLF